MSNATSVDVIEQHLTATVSELPPEIAAYLAQRLQCIGKELSEWDEWLPQHRRNAIEMADEQATIVEREAEQEAQKQAEGRYTLREAAERLEQEGGERKATMLRKLKEAAKAGALPVYEPGRNARYEIGSGKDAERVREYYEEAYWDSLNAWLEQNESRITFRFPVPTPAQAHDGVAAISDAPPAKANQPNAHQALGEGNQAATLSIGSNSKKSVDAYIERRAREIRAAGEATTMQCIAEIIAAEMESKGYRGERNDYLQWTTVVKSIPSGLTGGRGKNGRKPKPD